jgi:hypothetical protein
MDIFRTHHSVELGALVTLRTSAAAFGLAGTELAEILGRLGDEFAEELYFDAAEGLA